MLSRLVLSFWIFITFTFTIHTQILEPVHWSFEAKKITETEYDLIATAKLDKNWNIYSQYLESEKGPSRTNFRFTKGNHLELKGKCQEVSNHKKTGFDKLFKMNIIKYSEDVQFVQRVKWLDINTPISGAINFMTCDDEQCLPPTDKYFTFKTNPIVSEVKTETKKVEIPRADIVKKVAPKQSVPKTKVINVATTKTPKAITVATKEELKPEQKPESASVVDDAILEPVKWNFSVNKIDATNYELISKATIDKNWHIYSQNIVGEGPVPTSFTFTPAASYKLIGKVQESGISRKEHFDKQFDMNVVSFDNDATFIQKIEVSDPNTPIKGSLEYMVCDASRCLPPTSVDFNFNLNGESNIATNVPIANTASGENPVSKYVFEKNNAQFQCDGKTTDENTKSYWLIFLLGFLGGLFALLTPCVFPMIPLTVSYFTHSSKDKASGLRNALLYGISIIAIYLGLGLLVTSIFGADALNLLSTNAWFNIFFGILFIVFAFSFFGYFEITLPSSWANKSDNAANKGGIIGIFFMAFTLALVSFSCTGPIIGTLLVQTAAGGGDTLFGHIPITPLIGMFGFALALALPFALFAAFPAWLQSLPKAGGWMNSIKVVLGFVEIALALKFFSIADLTMGWKFLPYELFLALWVIIALCIGLYFLGILQFHGEKIAKVSPKFKSTFLVISALLLVYLGMGFRYSNTKGTFDTPSLLSGLAPPPGHSYIYPKDCPLNLNCFHDFEEGLAYAKSVNKPILVDFTGFGCVNCRRMEDNVWSKKEILDIIQNKYVLISLYVDDRKALEKTYVSSFSNREMKTVGNKWADFQAIHFNRNSQPYYILMSPDLKILNQPKGYTPDVNEYRSFLECGITQMSK
jgi:thiol:disulfide interchange protein